MNRQYLDYLYFKFDFDSKKIYLHLNQISGWIRIPYSWGDCHSWVCDGYQNIQYSTYGVLMLDMNWGWGGLDNGWYGFNNWDITDPNNPHDFQYADDMVYNIHP